MMVSGGVGPQNIREWFDAGAAFVAMGGALVGKDISIEENM